MVQETEYLETFDGDLIEKQDYIDLAVCIACFAVILASRLVFPNF